jgi:hypothetical protein
MNVLSPVTALVSAMLPVGVGLVQGEQLGLIGLPLPLAPAAAVLVSAGHGAGRVRWRVREHPVRSRVAPRWPRRALASRGLFG